MAVSLKERTIDSMIWVSIDKFGGFFLLFVSNLILARLLMPDDFGCIAMLHVFLAIADIIVHGGFGTALVQKKLTTHIDYSSVFYINLTVSFVLYGLLFVLAPTISGFYGIPLLIKVLRVQALVLIINSFSVVQLSILRKELRFKAIAVRNIVSSVIGVVVCIVCAWVGLGVWSLVMNILVARVIGIILLWKTSGWRPSLEFSFTSVKELFGFGGYMLISSIVNTIYNELQSLLVGKLYSARDLGYVNQAKKLEEIPSGTISSVVTQVSFPVFSKLQDDVIVLKKGMKKNIKSIQFINFPIVLLLIVIAEPLILLLYGERWSESIPYFQILCLSRLFGAVVPLNTCVISAKGKGKLYLITQLVKCVFSITGICISVRYGIYALMLALTIIPFFEFVICSCVNHKLIKYGLFEQVKDMLAPFLLSLMIGVLIYFIKFLIPWHCYLVMFVQITLYVALYLVTTKVLKFEAYEVYYNVFLEKKDKLTMLKKIFNGKK